MLRIQNLEVEIGGQKILQDVNLKVGTGEIHALMGPNGAGKTSLAMSLMGHPGYRVKGKGARVKIGNSELLKLKPEEKAKEGLFVAFQNPVAIPGVSVFSFLRTAYKALHPNDEISLTDFKKKVQTALIKVGLNEIFLGRGLGESFSGGEKKKLEIAQVLILQPKFAILDEVDSGLDIDSLKKVARAIRNLVKKNKMGFVLITHYPRIFHFIKPDKVHILIAGQIRASEGMKLVRKVEKEGYGIIGKSRQRNFPA